MSIYGESQVLPVPSKSESAFPQDPQVICLFVHYYYFIWFLLSIFLLIIVLIHYYISFWYNRIVIRHLYNLQREQIQFHLSPCSYHIFIDYTPLHLSPIPPPASLWQPPACSFFYESLFCFI